MPETWILVTNRIGSLGGQDKAVAALARGLLARGKRLRLVCFDVDAEFENDPRIQITRLKKLAGSDFVTSFALAAAGRRAAKEAQAAKIQFRVVTNGGNCHWGDINWVHAVHAAWTIDDRSSGSAERIKNGVTRWVSLRNERRAIAEARIVVANSQKTKQDLIRTLGIAESKIVAIPLGAESTWLPASADERNEARAALGLGADFTAAFVGGLGWDQTKGFDTAWEAWRRSSVGVLLVAGDGRALEHWKRKTNEAGLDKRVRFLGHVRDVKKVLQASDLMLCPSRYESFGLNAHEALAMGVPTIISKSSGVTERVEGQARELLLDEPSNAESLAHKINLVRQDLVSWSTIFRNDSARIRAYSWESMAGRIIDAVSGQ